MWSYIFWNTIILCILTSANSHNTHLNILRLSPKLYDVTFLLPQLPGICPFQKLNYTITIQQISPTHNTLSTAGQADNIIVIGPMTVVGRTNVNEVVNSNLVVDTMYSVLVNFASLAGNASSNTTFGKQISTCFESIYTYRWSLQKLWFKLSNSNDKLNFRL